MYVSHAARLDPPLGAPPVPSVLSHLLSPSRTVSQIYDDELIAEYEARLEAIDSLDAEGLRSLIESVGQTPPPPPAAAASEAAGDAAGDAAADDADAGYLAALREAARAADVHKVQEGAQYMGGKRRKPLPWAILQVVIAISPAISPFALLLSSPLACSRLRSPPPSCTRLLSLALTFSHLLSPSLLAHAGQEAQADAA